MAAENFESQGQAKDLRAQEKDEDKDIADCPRGASRTSTSPWEHITASNMCSNANHSLTLK